MHCVKRKRNLMVSPHEHLEIEQPLGLPRFVGESHQEAWGMAGE
jgi:hypothetical protein